MTQYYCDYGLPLWVTLCNLGSALLFPLHHMWPVWLGCDRLKLTPSPKKGPLSAATGPNTRGCHQECLFFPTNSSWSMGLVLCHSEESFLCGYKGWAPGPHAGWRGATCLWGSKRVIMKTWSVKRSRRGVLYRSATAGTGVLYWHCLSPGPRRELGKWLKPGNGHSLSPDWNQQFPVPGIFWWNNMALQGQFLYFNYLYLLMQTNIRNFLKTETNI